VITHVLDTSALLAHYLREPGADEVNGILASGPESVGISLITVVELRPRLFELEPDTAEADRVFRLYTETLVSVLNFTRGTAAAAIELRQATRPRLPLVDALIGGSAREHAAELVHRDPHMAALPSTMVKQRMLPAKA
jgi:predicted nucleic acid-binding protein